MRRFPSEFADLLSPLGIRILKGQAEDFCNQFKSGKSHFLNLPDLIDRDRTTSCIKLLDKSLYQYLTVEQRRIAPETISRMRENYEERLNKTIRIKTAFFRRCDARSYQAAEKIGLMRMMSSESFAAFAESVSGYRLYRSWSLQISCYEQGDYAGPHNDHHPEDPGLKNGFIDLHVMFSNDAVAHHYLVYEHKGHFSKIVDINAPGGVSVYRLPFWHYTTPLAGKTGRESEARRWLLLGSFQIDE